MHFLELANDSDRSADMLERLIYTPKQSMSRFEAKLTELKLQDQFYDWRHASSFVSKLRYKLGNLEVAKLESQEGVRQLAGLYEVDDAIFNSIDDSSGDMGTIFRWSECRMREQRLDLGTR